MKHKWVVVILFICVIKDEKWYCCGHAGTFAYKWWGGGNVCDKLVLCVCMCVSVCV